MADDYRELIQFLGKKFERIDEQFEEIRNTFARKDDLKAFATKDDLKAFATKDDLKAQADEYVHQNKIIAEDLQHKMDLLIEGFRFHDEKNERDKADIKESIERLDGENLHMRAELFTHDKRIKALEEGK